MCKLQKAIKDAQLKDIIYIAVRDDKQREEFKKLKGNDNTLSKYCEAGNSWDTANATSSTFDQTKTLTTQEIPAMSTHHSKSIAIIQKTIMINSSDHAETVAKVTKL